MAKAARKTAASKSFQVISPVNGEVYLERPYHTAEDADAALDAAKQAQKKWARTTLEKRQEILSKALDILGSWKVELAEEITHMIGRPLSQTPGELRGLEERGRYMIDIAEKSLADIVPEEKDGFLRRIKRVPVGVSAIVAPWNYPYLTSVNALFPALLAGNAVILKHSHQTPLVADRYAAAFAEAGLPDGVFKNLDLTHADTEKLLADPRTDSVSFTGSVKGGLAVQKAVVKKFIPAGLELGGKDPAYVRFDADIGFAAENLVDGAFFNAGQSCCGIERIYVHDSLFEDFLADFVRRTEALRLGNPFSPETTLGPMVRDSAAGFVRDQIAEAAKKGARTHIDKGRFPEIERGGAYLAPEVLTEVTHEMRIMREETFGPAVCIMPVENDEEALALMNDSDFGLTASVWTADTDAAAELAGNLEAGTVFMNRCDYLDPALPWTGVKNSGRGATLSILGFDGFIRPKSLHFRLKEE
ncbi:MAG: aldehyde dehydrogenase family protein [Micavibrio sp.]|nr:MAG: aldehyde dehydrogenase family protein [Micavibrio sp.]